MSKAAALLAPSSLAIVVATAGCLVEVGDGGDDDGVNLAGFDASAIQRLTSGGDRHHLDGLVIGSPAALDDPRSGADPLVGGVDHRADLCVVDHPTGPIATNSEHGGVFGSGCDLSIIATSVASADSTSVQSKQWLTRETGSPSSTSHSTTMPPWRAHRHFVTEVLDHPDGAVGWQDRVSLEVLGAYKLALPGETISRQVGLPAIGDAAAAPPCF